MRGGSPINAAITGEFTTFPTSQASLHLHRLQPNLGDGRFAGAYRETVKPGWRLGGFRRYQLRG